jgi:long-chain acyl-CoA synthetase
VGRPLDGVRLAVLGGDGRPCGPGETGEIHAHVGFTPDFAYAGDARRDERDGLVATGDMGFLDADGFLFLRDRRVHMGSVGGHTLYPAETEAVLWAHPDVADCACVIRGGELIALVLPRSGASLTLPGLRDWLGARLEPPRLPARLQLVDGLPRDDSGKLPKRRLVRLLSEGMAD